MTNYGDPGFAAYLRRSFAHSMGYSRELLSKPVVGITWTASDFNNCHRGVPRLVEAAKRGVLAAGGLPLDFPVPSLGEVFLNPTSMVFRNLMAMATEEMIRAQPMDARDPGRRLRQDPAGAGHGRDLGRQAGDHAGDRADDDVALSRRAPRRLHRLPPLLGEVPRRRGQRPQRSATSSRRLATTEGTCSVMGTASTMAILCETMGLMLPGTAAIPAVHADRLRAAEETGREAMRLSRAA